MESSEISLSLLLTSYIFCDAADSMFFRAYTTEDSSCLKNRNRIINIEKYQVVVVRSSRDGGEVLERGRRTCQIIFSASDNANTIKVDVRNFRSSDKGVFLHLIGVDRDTTGWWRHDTTYVLTAGSHPPAPYYVESRRLEILLNVTEKDSDENGTSSYEFNILLTYAGSWSIFGNHKPTWAALLSVIPLIGVCCLFFFFAKRRRRTDAFLSWYQRGRLSIGRLNHAVGEMFARTSSQPSLTTPLRSQPGTCAEPCVRYTPRQGSPVATVLNDLPPAYSDLFLPGETESDDTQRNDTAHRNDDSQHNAISRVLGNEVGHTSGHQLVRTFSDLHRTVMPAERDSSQLPSAEPPPYSEVTKPET